MNRRWIRSFGLTCAFVALVWPGLETPARAQRTAGSSAGSLADDDPDPEITRATCVLMLRGSSRSPMSGGPGPFVLVDLPAITAAMTTTGLVDPAVKATLGLGPRDWRKSVRIEVTPIGIQAVKLSVSVKPVPAEAPKDDPAGLLLRELVARARAVVDRSARVRREELKTRIDEMEKRRAELKASAEGLRKRVKDIEPAGFSGMNINLAQNRRLQLDAELEIKRSRLKAIESVLPRLVSEDELGKALNAVVAVRQAFVSALEAKVEQARADPLDLLRARIDLAEARVQAIPGARASSQPPGRQLRDERPGLEVDVLSLDAQIKALPGEPKPETRMTTEEFQSIRNEMFRTETEVNALQSQIQQAHREFDQVGISPTLTILDGQPD